MRIRNMLYSSKKRNPDLSYASKRERANIAFNIRVKLDIAKNRIHICRAPGRDKTQAAERFLIFAAQTPELNNQIFETKTFFNI